MSTRMMAVVWPLKMPPTCKAVLVSLADNANDAGECWPSIPTICERTCLGRTAVIDAIKMLECAGQLQADRSNGRHTRYLLTPNQDLFEGKNQSATRTSPPDKPVRQTDENTTNQSATRTKPVRHADSNRQEPSLKEKSNRQSARATRLPDDWEPDDGLREWFYSKHPQADLREAVEDFRDYWGARPGSVAMKLDWSATFRNSIRKFPPRAGPNKPLSKMAQALMTLEGMKHGQAGSGMVQGGDSDGVAKIGHAQP